MNKKIYGSQEVEVTVKLHLIMPNAEKKSPVSREVTTANYRECFSLIRESALFEFAALQFMHDVGIEETVIETMFGVFRIGILPLQPVPMSYCAAYTIVATCL